MFGRQRDLLPDIGLLAAAGDFVRCRRSDFVDALQLGGTGAQGRLGRAETLDQSAKQDRADLRSQRPAQVLDGSRRRNNG